MWLTPEGRLQCFFTQLTGPKDNPVSEVPILESADSGVTCTRVPGDVPVGSGRGMAVLPNGALVRLHWASDPNDAGWTERSEDGGRTWADPVHFLSPQEYRAWPSVTCRLRDGRLVLMAGVWKRGDGDVPNKRMTKMMFVSDDEGRSWGEPVVLMPTEVGVCEESDLCELPSGHLFWIHRGQHFPEAPGALHAGAAPMAPPFVTAYSDRMQSVVYRRGDGREPGPATVAPFPHSGFPEVMLTAQGVILDFATDGIYWTGDVGQTWTRIPIPGTSYYPRAYSFRTAPSSASATWAATTYTAA